jgi:hypothetical protein
MPTSEDVPVKVDLDAQLEALGVAVDLRGRCSATTGNT